ncbi:YrhB domain-containing protein [Sphingomonas sp.]|uniref:YrhB domain-containing protein n=1 Tax=Sphingomonas sp. TaxID=28214 RepID=UPI003B3A3BD4
MKISLEKARILADEEVKRLGKENNDDFIILDNLTIEKNNGWLFFYNTRDFFLSGNVVDSLVGNGPIFVSHDGLLTRLPSSQHWKDS